MKLLYFDPILVCLHVGLFFIVTSITINRNKGYNNAHLLLFLAVQSL